MVHIGAEYSLEIIPGFSRTFSPTRYLCSSLSLEFSFLLLASMMPCLRCLVQAQSVFNWIGSNISLPKTNCPGVASNIPCTVLRMAHVAALRNDPQGSFGSSSLFSSANVLSALPST